VTTTHDGAEGAPAGPPPWINETMQQEVEWRDGDVVVAVPPKSGTTWTMNIVHQLRSGGDASFVDIYAEVPWLEFVPGPERTPESVVAEIDAMSRDRRRGFKTHAAPPTLPYQSPGVGPDVRYLIVARNPDEAIASFRPFIAAHSDAWYDLWHVDKDAIVGPDFETYVAGFVSHALAPMIFGFLAQWWPLRHESNVMFVHYADLKREPEPTIRRMAEFLGFDVAPDQWPAVLEYTSFPWMKAHEDKFELRTLTEFPMLDSGAMIRKGQIGASAEDGITPQISEIILGVGRTILTNQLALNWCYDGGALSA
jgi:aryl sulfotransferase